MNNVELVQEIRGQLTRLRAEHQQVIGIESLDVYLGQLEAMASAVPNQLDQVTLGRLRSRLDIRLAEHKRIADQGLEGFKAVIRAGQAAIQSTVLVNGGASVALLAFLGHLAGLSTDRAVVAAAARPLLCFVGGLLAGAMAFGTTYLAQSYWNHGKNSAGGKWNRVSIGLIILSYAAFGVGAWCAYRILSAWH